MRMLWFVAAAIGFVGAVNWPLWWAITHTDGPFFGASFVVNFNLALWPAVGLVVISVVCILRAWDL